MNRRFNRPLETVPRIGTVFFVSPSKRYHHSPQHPPPPHHKAQDNRLPTYLLQYGTYRYNFGCHKATLACRRETEETAYGTCDSRTENSIMPHIELPQAEFKVVMLGDTFTGKTSLVLRFAEGYFRESGRSPTVGAFFVTKR